jgi:hypothetical protein
MQWEKNKIAGSHTGGYGRDCDIHAFRAAGKGAWEKHSREKHLPAGSQRMHNQAGPVSGQASSEPESALSRLH